MPAPPPITLWIDPGGQTGFACLEFGTFWAEEHPWDRACDKLTGLASYWRSMLYVGYEKFTILPSTHKLSPQPEAYEFPGVIKYVARTWGCRLLPPARPSERLVATPGMLRRIGWWVPGKDDAQSASQHLLAFCLREDCLPYALAPLVR
jgi:hypothetical protein